MRCRACDTIMTDFELSRKDSQGVHYDMCSDCLRIADKAVSDIEADVDVLIDRDYAYPDDELDNIAGGDEISLY